MELQHHHRDYARHRQAKHDQESAKGFLLAGVLSSDFYAHARGRPRSGEDLLHVVDDAAERPAANVGRRSDHLLLILAQQLGARFGWLEISERPKRHRCAGLGRDDRQCAQSAWTEADGVGSAHSDPDGSVLESHLSGWRAQQSSHRRRGDLFGGETHSVGLGAIYPH